MRVLMLTHNLAGVSSFLRAHGLARWLVRDGWEVTLVASRAAVGLRRLDETRDGVRVVQLADVIPRRLRNAGLSPLDVAGRIAHALARRVDLVHAFEPRPASTAPALVARRRWRVPFVADCADLWGFEGMASLLPSVWRPTLGRLDDVLERRTRRTADGVTAISTDLQRRAIELGVPADRVALVPVGASAGLVPGLGRAAARARLGLPTDARVVAHTAFAPFDTDLVAGTVVELARADPRVLLVTTGRDDPVVRGVLERAGLAARQHHLGQLPYERVGEVLAAADVALLPYRPTPVNVARSPNRFGDYVGAGLPVVTNPTGDLGALVERERLGAVVPPDPAAMARAAAALLDDPAARADIALRARELAATRLSWRASAAAVDDLYRVVLGRAA